MALVFTASQARFEDVCSVEEALPLLEFLRNCDAPEVDLSGCTFLHTALLQLLLTARPKLAVYPTDPALARWVAPLLADDRLGRGIDG